MMRETDYHIKTSFVASVEQRWIGVMKKMRYALVDMDKLKNGLEEHKQRVLNSDNIDYALRCISRRSTNSQLKAICEKYESIISECICVENPLAEVASTPTINPDKNETFVVPLAEHDKSETSVDYSIKSDKGKFRPTLCHCITIEAVSRAREHGASRYGGTETWKRVEEQRYKDALYRHWLAYLENPDGVDADSGLLSLWHVACNVDFLLELQRERMSGNELQRAKGSG